LKHALIAIYNLFNCSGWHEAAVLEKSFEAFKLPSLLDLCEDDYEAILS
jgi:hypothetical protein